MGMEFVYILRCTTVLYTWSDYIQYYSDIILDWCAV